MDSRIDPRRVLAIVARRTRAGAWCLFVLGMIAMLAIILLAPELARGRDLFLPLVQVAAGAVLPSALLLLLSTGIERGRMGAIIFALVTSMALACLYVAYAALQILAVVQSDHLRLGSSIAGFLAIGLVAVQIGRALSAAQQIRELRAITFAALISTEPVLPCQHARRNAERASEPAVTARSA